jgi:hypothetical protein
MHASYRAASNSRAGVATRIREFMIRGIFRLRLHVLLVRVGERGGASETATQRARLPRTMRIATRNQNRPASWFRTHARTHEFRLYTEVSRLPLSEKRTLTHAYEIMQPDRFWPFCAALAPIRMKLASG